MKPKKLARNLFEGFFGWLFCENVLIAEVLPGCKKTLNVLRNDKSLHSIIYLKIYRNGITS